MVYRPTEKTVQRKEARRRRLLTQAIRLFGRKGFHATTVPMIVAAAGSSIGTFYLYFRNKEDIFAAALESIGERIAAALNTGIAKAGPDPIAHMRAAMASLVEFLAENAQEARILIVESSGLGGGLDSIRRRIIESHTRGVEQALAALADRLPPMETAVAASCWVGAVYESVFRWLDRPAKGRISADRLAGAIIDFNLRAIGAYGEDGGRGRPRHMDGSDERNL